MFAGRLVIKNVTKDDKYISGENKINDEKSTIGLYIKNTIIPESTANFTLETLNLKVRNINPEISPERPEASICHIVQGP